MEITIEELRELSRLWDNVVEATKEFGRELGYLDSRGSDE